MKTQEERKAAVELRRKIATEKAQRPLESLTITIEWKKSRTWGSNPHATAEARYREGQNDHRGSYERRNGYTASGCGYDKESEVISYIFNDFLKYKLWNKTIEECKRNDYDWKEKGGAPYGISAGEYQGNEYRYYDGGIGTNCYRAISEFIGGKFETIASGKTFGVFKYTDNA